MDIEKRILDWLKEVIEKNRNVEVLSFYNEIPIRVKLKPKAIEENFIHWENEPKLNLALGETGKIFTQFLDPQYGEKRILEADVTYFSDKFLESGLLRLSHDPRLFRETLRVRVSDSLPVEVFVINNGKKEKLEVWDISENGIGLITPKDYFNYNQNAELEIVLPFGTIKTQGTVVSKEPYDSKEKVGIFLPNLSQKDKNLLCRYIMKRQKEILKTIRLLLE